MIPKEKLDKTLHLWYNVNTLNEGVEKMKNMKGIKNLSIRRILPVLLVGTTLTFTGCSGKVNMDKYTMSELMANEEVKDLTLMDELIEQGNLMYTDELNYIEAANQLERYMDIVEEIESIDYSEVSQLAPLTAEEYLTTLDLSLGEVQVLKTMATSKATDLVSMERKLTAMKKLDYLYRNCKEWISQNGRNLTSKLMIHTVKSSLADELGISTEDYSTITIPPIKDAKTANEGFKIEVGDSYYVVPTSSDEIWNTISYTYRVQHDDFQEDSDKKSGSIEYKTYRKAINYAKTTLSAGANIKNGKI